MPNNSTITVRKGGKLVVDGGVITNYCGGMWNGIVVEGTALMAQTATNHGWCEVKNGGVIENARIAIKSNDGGVVRVINGKFINNRFGVFFSKYSLAKNQIHSNYSVIANSTFKCYREMIDRNYVDDGMYEGSKYFVGIAQQSGIRIINNNFESTYHPRADLKGTGVVTWGSRTYIHNNDFAGLTFGIEAAGFQNALQANSVFGNEFTNVSLAITETAQAGSQIRENTIVLPAYESNAWLMENYGIKEDVSRGFNITNNSIESSNSIQSNINIYGILVRNSQNLPCNVDHNIFEKLEYGTQLEGDNNDIGIQCNTYNNSTQDWSINPVTIGEIHDFGLENPSLIQAANLFNDNEGLTSSRNIRINESMQLVYNTVINPSEAVPQYVTDNKVTVLPILGTSYNEECEVPFDPCGGNPVPCVAYAEDLVNNNTEASAELLFKYKLNLAQQLKDSGMIEELRQMIEAETSSEWEELKLPMYIEYGANMNVNPQDIIDNLPIGEYKDFMQLALDINNESLPIDSVGDIGLTGDIATLADGVTPISNASKKILEIFFGYQYVREAERWEESNMVVHNNTKTTKALTNEVEEYFNEHLEENKGLNQKIKPELILMPNPSNGNFLIKLSSSASGLINIIDMHGKIIKEVNIEENGDLTIEKGILLPGVYTIRLLNGAQSYQLNKRLIILE